MRGTGRQVARGQMAADEPVIRRLNGRPGFGAEATDLAWTTAGKRTAGARRGLHVRSGGRAGDVMVLPETRRRFQQHFRIGVQRLGK